MQTRLSSNIAVSTLQRFKQSLIVLHCPSSVLQLEFVSDKFEKNNI